MAPLLTKSLFLLALDCPTKLYYRTNDYSSSTSDDEFLIALAEGGMQVGALAKCYYPEGVLVKEINPDEAVEKTKELLTNENVTIFEAAFRNEECFVRVDILEKRGDEIRIIEVKSKSYKNKKEFFTKKGLIAASWKQYFNDLAFQTFVVCKSVNPDLTVRSFFLLANKTLRTSIAGLNQQFKISKVNGNAFVEHTTAQNTGTGLKILGLEEVTKAVNDILESSNIVKYGKTFIEFIRYLQELLRDNKKADPELTSGCKNCEFSESDEKNGFGECWNEILAGNIKNSESLVYNIGGYKKTDDNFKEDVYFINELNEADFDVIPDPGSNVKLNTKSRQRLQVMSHKEKMRIEYINKKILQKYFDTWVFPYHLIDFETSRVAIPFHKNKRPYQSITFQFSHHTIDKDWNIEHKGEFLKIDADCPNIEFVRELNNQLSKDKGTVFIYSPYENSILKELKEEIKDTDGNELSDKKELIGFINKLTGEKSKRKMVDLLEILKATYYDSDLGGSNSLKKVLPVILNSSEYLKNKYSKPIYGTGSIVSRNFTNKIWVEFDDSGKVIDPYKIITTPDELVSEEEAEKIYNTIDIANGSSAMLAYSQLLSTDMVSKNRSEIEKALLQYCELDTFATVVLMEFWWNRMK
ncbi:MAG: DUF2779 domain-containing protein [Ignavibacteria bacterium]